MKKSSHGERNKRVAVTKSELKNTMKKDKVEDHKMIREAIKHHEKAMHHSKKAHEAMRKAHGRKK